MQGSADECVFFYAEIQDGCQKWQENDFWGKSPVDSAYILQVKIFRRNHSILHCLQNKCILCRNSRWPPKNGGEKCFLGKITSRVCLYPAGQNFAEIAIFFFFLSSEFHMWRSVMSTCLITEVKQQWAMLVLG